MAFFLDPEIHVKYLGGKWWSLLREVRYGVGSKDSDEVITVPVGFETDFASIPSLLWNLLPPFGKYAAAAIVHDYLYRNHHYPRKRSDQIFLEAMLAHGVARWKAHIMYRAVRIFGGRPYRVFS